MPKRNRQTLKECFKQGKRPTESDFENLIDSTLNILDDGFSKSMEAGIELSPLQEKGVVLSVYSEVGLSNPQWEIAIDRKTRNLYIQRYISKDMRSKAITLAADGSIILGDVGQSVLIKGKLSMSERQGTFREGSVPANGQWQDISEDLEGSWALEVVAGCGKRHSGKHAVLVATATHCYGSRPDIRKTSSHFGIRGNKIKLRWKKNELKAKLQIRTFYNYGEDVQIYFHITNLWKFNLGEQ